MTYSEKEPRVAGVPFSGYDVDLDVSGKYRGELGIRLASAKTLRDDRRNTFDRVEPVKRIDELSDPVTCKAFVDRVESDGFSKKLNLDVERKVGLVRARLPEYYAKNAESFNYNVLGYIPVGRKFQGVLERARNTVKKSKSNK